MPIIPRVGRRNPKIVLVIFTLYAVLSLGGMAMVYPFLITLTGAVSNAYEYEEYNVLPYYVWDQQECYLKYVVEKYYKRPFQLFRSCYVFPGRMNDFRDVHRNRRLVHDYFPAFEFIVVEGMKRLSVFQHYVVRDIYDVTDGSLPAGD